MSNNGCKINTKENFDINHLCLTDVMDISVLQCFQDDFAKGVGFASTTVDLAGNPVTKPSNYTRLCMDFNHATKCGDKRCAMSHRIGGKEAARLGKPVVYECRAGLIDFAAPILLEGRHIGTILGGQVLISDYDEGKFRSIAREIDVNEEAYIDALQEIRIMSKEQVDAAANVLFIVANYMSKTAYYQQLLSARSNVLSNSLNQISVSVQELAGLARISNIEEQIAKLEVSEPMTPGHFNEVIDLTKKIEEIISLQQKEMARLDRLNLIGEMAASIGHEVRNPLTTVRGFLQHFSQKNEFKNYDDVFGIMIEELDRANEIITEFLSLAKNRKVDLKQMDLNSIIMRLIPLIKADALIRGIKIITDFDKLPVLLLDEKEIRQLVLNLVRNAMEASDSGGVVEIRTLVQQNKPILEIIDNGKGIPRTILDKLGTPFLSTKAQGTGLGLAVCYRIAERHSAFIRVESEESVGTKVRVIFNLNEC
ncbi:MAG: PocR ligand-binding domain-containing protein [Pelosinus sp.]|nr:PocR ligand-binding domain-containing protein [Pelosinus sp.]